MAQTEAGCSYGRPPCGTKKPSKSGGVLGLCGRPVDDSHLMPCHCPTLELVWASSTSVVPPSLPCRRSSADGAADEGRPAAPFLCCILSRSAERLFCQILQLIFVTGMYISCQIARL